MLRGRTRARASQSTLAPLRFVTANGYGPGNGSVGMAVNAITTQVDYYARSYFVIGSGDVSQLVLSFFNWFLAAGGGISVTGMATMSIVKVAIEYNGTFAPVTFGGLRTKTINVGDTDIQSDAVLPGALGATKFTRGTTGYIRVHLTQPNASTANIPSSAFNVIGGNTKLKCDPNKVSLTNDVDSTGDFTYTMINGGVNGTDAVFVNTYYMPAVLGKYVTGDPGSWILAGDSKTYGTGDTSNGTAQGVLGLTRAMFPDATLAANAYSSWNMGSPSGVGSDWATGVTTRLTSYIKYAKNAIEVYGTNAITSSFSTAIHAQLRAGGVKLIIRTSISPRTTSTDTWITEANQTYVTNWGPGGTVNTFETTMKGLVASDLTYFDFLGVRGVDPFKWVINGVANYATADGTHPTAAGYELEVGANGSIIAQSGTTTGTLRSVIVANS